MSVLCFMWFSVFIHFLYLMLIIYVTHVAALVAQQEKKPVYDIFYLDNCLILIIVFLAVNIYGDRKSFR